MNSSQHHTAHTPPTQSTADKIAHNTAILSQLSVQVCAKMEPLRSLRYNRRSLDSRLVQAMVEGYLLTLLQYACQLTYRHLLLQQCNETSDRVTTATLRVLPHLPYIENVPASPEWSVVQLQQLAYFPKPESRRKPVRFVVKSPGGYGDTYLEKWTPLPSIHPSWIPEVEWQRILNYTAAGDYRAELTVYDTHLSVAISL